MGAVMANKMTAAAAEFQKQWVERARALNEKEAVYIDGSVNKSIRIDGQVCVSAETFPKHCASHADAPSSFT